MKKVLSVLIIFLFCLYNAQALYAIQEDDYMAIERKTKHLGSRLHTQYSGYIYTITNNSNQNLNISSINFQDNLSAKAAYKAVRRSNTKIFLSTIGSGLVHAIPTLTLSLICGAVAAPIKVVSNTIGNVGAKIDSNRFNKISNEQTLKPHNKIQLKTLGLNGQKPTINVIYTVQNDTEIKTLSY